MRVRIFLVCALVCLSAAACDRSIDGNEVPTSTPVKRIAEHPAEVQFPLVPLKPGEAIVGLEAYVPCDISLEWQDLPDGWLMARHRSNDYRSVSLNVAQYDKARAARGEFVPVDANGVLPRLWIADTSGDCGKWEVSVDIGTSSMSPDDPYYAYAPDVHVLIIDHESPMAWYNAPQTAAE